MKCYVDLKEESKRRKAELKKKEEKSKQNGTGLYYTVITVISDRSYEMASDLSIPILNQF